MLFAKIRSATPLGAVCFAKFTPCWARGFEKNEGVPGLLKGDETLRDSRGSTRATREASRPRWSTSRSERPNDRRSARASGRDQQGPARPLDAAPRDVDMTSHQSGRRDLRPAEAASGSDAESERAERLYGCGTPMPDKFDASEWEPYSMRKHSGGSQSAWGVLRNDRTPLNTPCTPAVVKLQLRRHDEQHEGSQSTTRELVATVRSSALYLLQPLWSIRSLVDRVITWLLPRSITQWAMFQKYRGWVVWYLTAVLSIPLALLLSPIVIAVCICTSPVWLAGGVVLIIRACVLPPTKTPTATLSAEYAHSPGQHPRVNGTRGINGVVAANLHHQHSTYRRTTLLSSDVIEG